MPSSFTDLSSLLTLPAEIQTHVVSFIQDPKTFIAFSLACKQTHGLLRDSATLKKIFYKGPIPNLDLTSLNDFWQGPHQKLKEEWRGFYKFYNTTQPLLIVIKNLQDFQKSWLADLQIEKRKEIGLLTQQQKKSGLKKLLSNYEMTKSEEMQSKLDEAWYEAGLSGDFKKSLSVEKIQTAVDLLFKHLIIKFVRLMAKKEGNFCYKDGILMHSGLHAWALTPLSGEGKAFISAWINQIVNYNSPKLLLTILRQPCFQKLLEYEEYASKLGQMIDGHEKIFLAIFTNPVLQPIKESLLQFNSYAIVQNARAFPTVAQCALSQPKLIQKLNASQLQAICASHANFFKLFQLPDTHHEEKLYYLFMLQPEMSRALGQLEEDFKAYQQEPEIAIFLRQQGMISFYHFLSQMAEYTKDRTISFEVSHPIYPKAVKILDADFLNHMNLSALGNPEKRKAVIEGKLSLKTLVSNTPNTDAVDTRLRSLRLSP